MSDYETSAEYTDNAGSRSTVADGRDLTTWEKVRQGLEPARVAEGVRALVVIVGFFGLTIPAEQTDIITGQFQAIAGGVTAAGLLGSFILTTFVRNRVTPVNKLDGGH